MITIIEGAKGSGKTKKIIEMANNGLSDRKGDTVFLAATARYRQEIKPQIKFVDVKDDGIVNKDMLIGFIKGVLATNYDIEYIFIDGIYKIMGVAVNSPEMAEVFMVIDQLCKTSTVNFVLTVSADKADLPEFIAKYLA